MKKPYKKHIYGYRQHAKYTALFYYGFMIKDKNLEDIEKRINHNDKSIHFLKRCNMEIDEYEIENIDALKFNVIFDNTLKIVRAFSPNK